VTGTTFIVSCKESAMSVNPITVSVIVPAYNASATIGRTLEALSRQKCSQAFEVIVVDDGSIDDTVKIVASFGSVRYVRQKNAGPASARNHGASLAQGEFLAFTDSDCVPHEDWIMQLTERTRSLKGDRSERSDLSPFSDLVRSGAVVVVCGSYGIANPQFILARCVYKEILWRHTHLMPDYPNSFGSYNFCVKKSVFDALGGFNTAYAQASGEDNDLSYKITGAGWRIYFERKALVDHYHPTLVVKYLKEQFRHGFWRLKMYRDHPAMMRGDGYTFWKDALEIPWAGIVLLGFTLSAFHCLRLGDVVFFVVFPFWAFEILFAIIMTRCFFEGIFFSFILLFRALSRMVGFSTGILSFLFKKKEKIFQ